MLGATVIVFREVLEAALIITIVLAATRGLATRLKWVSGGVTAGLVGATIIAFFAEAISMAMEGIGQEVFNASILFAAVILLAWHNIWMASHGRALAQQMKTVGHNVTSGEQPMHALAIVVGLAVLREGAEVVLFLNGIATSGADNSLSLLGGSLLGLIAGIVIGILMYSGLVRIPLKHFFAVTGWLILLICAGLASSAAGYLEQAGLLPAITPMVWDSSSLLSQQSVFGQLLHILVGYHDRPNGIQLVFYVAVLIVVPLLAYFVKTLHNQKRVATMTL